MPRALTTGAALQTSPFTRKRRSRRQSEPQGQAVHAAAGGEEIKPTINEIIIDGARNVGCGIYRTERRRNRDCRWELEPEFVAIRKQAAFWGENARARHFYSLKEKEVKGTGPSSPK